MSELLIIRDRLQRALDELFNNVRSEEDGLVLYLEKTKAAAYALEVTEPQNRRDLTELGLPVSMAQFMAIIALEVRAENAMFRWVATEGQNLSPIGRTSARIRDDGLYNIFFEYAVAGGTMDLEEAQMAILTVIQIATDVCDEFVSQFGGITWKTYESRPN